MAYERLVPGYMLTEKDVAEILKNGTKSADYLRRRRKMCMQVSQGEKELIADSFLGSLSRREGSIGAGKRKSWRGDPVYRSFCQKEQLEESQNRLRQEELTRIHYAGNMIRRVWDGFYALDPDTQDILERYYIRKETPSDIMRSLNISESTFWRKKKLALQRIAGYSR